jgi:hypothetical protein
LQLLDRIGMPFEPKRDEDLRQPTPEDPGPVHPGMAAGAGRHQLGVVAGPAVMNIQIVSGVTAAASPAVALESRIPVPSKETRRIPPTPVKAMHSPATAGVPCPQEQNRLRWNPAPRLSVAGLASASRSKAAGAIGEVRVMVRVRHIILCIGMQ